MKKITLILASIFISLFCMSQDNSLQGSTYDWKHKSTYRTEWKSIDTIVKPVASNKRDWVSYFVDMVDTITPYPRWKYSPIDNNRYAKRQFEEFRLCKVTGIRQHRYLVQEFEIIFKKRYEVIMYSLKNVRK